MPRFEKIRKFIKDESGATSIEYALIAGGLSIAILATVNTLGSNLNVKWMSVSTAFR